jgi:hypothetical protein
VTEQQKSNGPSLVASATSSFAGHLRPSGLFDLPTVVAVAVVAHGSPARERTQSTHTSIAAGPCDR